MIPDQHTALVPNIGIVIGTDAVLVVESGLGRENGKRVLQKAMEVAGSKPLLLTSTHFHPEHAFGTQAFKGHATIILNTAQADELGEKGASYLNIFRGLGPDVHKALEGVEFVMPDETYQGERAIAACSPNRCSISRCTLAMASSRKSICVRICSMRKR